VPKMVAQWNSAAGNAPDPQTVRSVAATLREPAKDVVLTWVYEQALAARDFAAPNFLGLAAIHLDSGDVAGAMPLLNRMLLVSGDLYADMDSAAALLEERNHPEQAIQFLRPLAQASPWNAGYKVRLAKAMLAVTPHAPDSVAMLQAVAGDANAQYAQRVAAAEALKGQAQPGSFGGAAELALLAQPGCPTPQQASQPMFIQARVAAAACASSDAVREPLLRDALALAPSDRSIRLHYVWAAFGSGQETSALLAAAPLMPRISYDGYAIPQYRYSDRFTTLQRGPHLEPAEAGRLYLLVVQALEKQQEDAAALRDAQLGLPLAVGSPQHASLAAEEKRLAAQVQRQQENAARAPAIHPALDQDHVVQTRLAAEVTQ